MLIIEFGTEPLRRFIGVVVIVPVIVVCHCQRSLVLAMVVNAVMNDSDTAPVTFINQLAQVIGLAIVILDGKDAARVIAPRTFTGEFVTRHQFNRIDSKITQVVQLVDHVLEAPLGLAIFVISRAAGKIPYVKFIDNKLVIVPQQLVIVLPLIAGIDPLPVLDDKTSPFG